MDSSQLVAEYELKRSLFSDFTLKLKALLTELMVVHCIRVHVVEERTKAIDSFRNKILLPEKNYRRLQDVHDLSGVRVIVYYNDDIEKVSSVIRREFSVIEESNFSEIDFDRFGYSSHHASINLSEQRSSLTEWIACRGLIAEIQVRTVLQHSWAAVSHALQYKHEEDAPRSLRRRFSRLAGLIELADDEFAALRKAHFNAIAAAKASVKSDTTTTLVDAATVREFLRTWEKLPEKKAGGPKFQIKFMEETDEKLGQGHEDYAAIIARHCARLGIESIKELETTIDIDPNPFLARISDKFPWNMPDSFFAYLLLIFARPESFTFQQLLLEGWHEFNAERVIRAANNSERPRG
jgi:ppGpp synthetase/RelA/SpoT-type nucleotidyltranferase